MKERPLQKVGAGCGAASAAPSCEEGYRSLHNHPCDAIVAVCTRRMRRIAFGVAIWIAEAIHSIMALYSRAALKSTPGRTLRSRPDRRLLRLYAPKLGTDCFDVCKQSIAREFEACN
jgi:hypothetical protein